MRPAQALPSRCAAIATSGRHRLGIQYITSIQARCRLQGDSQIEGRRIVPELSDGLTKSMRSDAESAIRMNPFD